MAVPRLADKSTPLWCCCLPTIGCSRRPKRDERRLNSNGEPLGTSCNMVCRATEFTEAVSSRFSRFCGYCCSSPSASSISPTRLITCSISSCFRVSSCSNWALLLCKAAISSRKVLACTAKWARWAWLCSTLRSRYSITAAVITRPNNNSHIAMMALRLNSLLTLKWRLPLIVETEMIIRSFIQASIRSMVVDCSGG